jgi:hypothetical protein
LIVRAAPEPILDGGVELLAAGLHRLALKDALKNIWPRPKECTRRSLDSLRLVDLVYSNRQF